MHTLLISTLSLLVAAETPRPLPDARTFAAEQQTVALELYRQLASEPGNVIFSPWSLARAFAMAHEGAAGETAAELERALSLSSGAGEAFAALALAMQPRKGGAKFDLEFAASMWGQRGEPFQREFLARLKSAYASELYPVDFRQSAVVCDAINRWVSERTHERIRELVAEGQLKPDTRLVLVDAAYFKAGWLEPFYEQGTWPAKFVTDVGEIAAATMHRTDYFTYGETELAQVIELPYVGGMSMLIVLPKERSSAALANVVEHESFATWLASVGAREVALALPKFRLEFAADCVPVMRRLGVELAFDAERADFSRIGAQPFFISAVHHKAFIECDEKGTQAAAATALVVALGSSMTPQPAPVPFTADHPFLFAIRHPATGAVLFMGRVDDPTHRVDG